MDITTSNFESGDDDRWQVRWDWQVDIFVLYDRVLSKTNKILSEQVTVTWIDVNCGDNQTVTYELLTGRFLAWLPQLDGLIPWGAQRDVFVCPMDNLQRENKALKITLG